MLAIKAYKYMENYTVYKFPVLNYTVFLEV